MKTIWVPVLLILTASLAAEEADAVASEKKALAPFQNYVGEWKGSGIPKNSKDTWGEESDWAWEFKGGHAALVFNSPKGRYFTGGKLIAGKKANEFQFVGTLPEGKGDEKWSGTVAKNELALLPDASAEGRPDKITIELLAKGARQVLTFYKKSSNGSFAPIAELGFTRKGSNFGKDVNAQECVVTGGLGTIAVKYKNETYYVCCGGCKEEFQDNPEKILAEYRKRKEEEKNSK